MLEKGFLICLARFRSLANLNAIPHLPVPIAEGLQRRTNGVLDFGNALDILDRLRRRLSSGPSCRIRAGPTDSVKSAKPVLKSPPLPRAAIRISAMNSGKLLRHEALIVVIASLSSFSFLPDRRTITSSHFGCIADKLAEAERARKAFFNSDRLINEPSEDVVEVNRFRRGVTKARNVDSIFEGRGASSVRSLYSSCQRSINDRELGAGFQSDKPEQCTEGYPPISRAHFPQQLHPASLPSPRYVSHTSQGT